MELLKNENDSLRLEIKEVTKSHRNQIKNISEKLNDKRIGIWDFDYTEDYLRLIMFEELPNATVYELVDKLNKIIKPSHNPSIKIISISKGTVFVKILDSELLTQRMGSSGAMEYLVRVTFTLTSLPDIKYVNFDFQLGDHAKPGTRSRFSYLDLL